MTDDRDVPEVVDALDRDTMVLVGPARLTHGAYELIEDTRARGAGTVPHVHDAHDEAFYVLDGRFRFLRDLEEIEAGPGAFLFVPRGTRHGYTALDSGSRLLFVVSPPGLSGFLRAQGALIASGLSTGAATARLSARFDVRVVD